ncbi:MAG: endonuclease, partial [Bacilli bacterium]|nr:endonuclease [Bacilli bacterium]
MKKNILLFALTTLMLSGCGKPKEKPIPGYIVADYYDGYYASIVSWKNGEDLKNQLNTLIRTGYTALTYEQNWTSNIDADHIQDNYFYVDGVYASNDLVSANTQKAWQREHAFCASLMCGSTTSNATKNKGRATDFHNLFAADASGNNSRGNKNFGVADTTNANYQNRTVKDGYDGYSFDNKIFEPGDKDKGRLARAIFYMGTMYKDDEIDTKNNVTMKGLTIQEEYVDYVAGNDGAFAIGSLSTLLNWNNAIPVDRLEMQHNVSVLTNEINGVAQGNRNPYVDYPELVDYVYGNKKDKAGEMKYIKPSAIELDANSDEHRYYTIKSAETSFGVGDTFDKNSIEIIDVKKNFKYVTYAGEFTTSLDGYTFNKDDVTNGVDNIVTIEDM